MRTSLDSKCTEEKIDFYEREENVTAEAAPDYENLNPEEPPLTDAPSTNYLPYGYNVLKYGYINAANVNKDAAIFDSALVKEDTTGKV